MGEAVYEHSYNQAEAVISDIRPKRGPKQNTNNKSYFRAPLQSKSTCRDSLLKNELVSSSETGGYGDVYFLTSDMEGNMEIFHDIVKKFEKSKKLSDFTSTPEFFQRVMKQTNDAVIITNSEGQAFFWNKSAEALLGYKEEEIIGDIPQIFSDKSIQNEMIKKVEAGEQVMGFETKLKHKSEYLIDVSITMDAIKDENQKIMGFCIISRDITERRKAEEALRESEELHRITLSSISDTVIITNDDGKFTFICPNIDFIFGYSNQEVQSLGHVSELLGQDLFDRKELLKKGEIKNIDLDAKDKSGRIHSLLMNVKNVSIKGGTILYTLHDVTKRKKAEESLKISEERYALAQQAANIGSWDWDILTGDLVWSDTIEEMFGFSPGEFGATYEAFLECVHPEDRQFVMDSVNACVDEGKDYDIKHRIMWPDGSIRVVSEIGNVFRDENGKAIRMLGIVQDITDRKNAEKPYQE
jgi:PAS domain S-box-containing protein